MLRLARSRTRYQFLIMNMTVKVYPWIDQGVEYTKKVHDIMTASSQVDRIIKDTKVNSQEPMQFRDNKAVQAGGKHAQVGKWLQCMQKDQQNV